MNQQLVRLVSQMLVLVLVARQVGSTTQMEDR